MVYLSVGDKETVIAKKPFNVFDVLFLEIRRDGEVHHWVLAVRFKNGHEKQIGSIHWKKEKAQNTFNRIDATIAKIMLEMWYYYGKYWQIQTEVNNALREPGFDSLIRHKWDDLLKNYQPEVAVQQVAPTQIIEVTQTQQIKMASQDDNGDMVTINRSELETLRFRESTLNKRLGSMAMELRDAKNELQMKSDIIAGLKITIEQLRHGQFKQQ